jgi:hypothetical protein
LLTAAIEIDQASLVDPCLLFNSSFFLLFIYFLFSYAVPSFLSLPLFSSLAAEIARDGGGGTSSVMARR